jgi:hypothetical protein
MANKALLVALLACACGSDSPADVAGTYTLSLTVSKDDCGILGNSVGESSSGVQMIVAQSGSQVSGQVQGIAGLALTWSMGTDTFTGTVEGNSLDLSISGTMAGSSGTCAYTRNAHLAAKVSGDVIEGKVTYTYVTNKTADCGALTTCQDEQLLNGTRPPKL